MWTIEPHSSLTWHPRFLKAQAQPLLQVQSLLFPRPSPSSYSDVWGIPTSPAEQACIHQSLPFSWVSSVPASLPSFRALLLPWASSVPEMLSAPTRQPSPTRLHGSSPAPTSVLRLLVLPHCRLCHIGCSCVRHHSSVGFHLFNSGVGKARHEHLLEESVPRLEVLFGGWSEKWETTHRDTQKRWHWSHVEDSRSHNYSTGEILPTPVFCGYYSLP